MKERGESGEVTGPCPDDDRMRASGLCCWFIRQAARAAPAELSHRLEEEWLADLESRSSAVSRLSFAIGCVWATRVIAHDHCRESTPVGAPAWVARTVSRETPPLMSLLTRRSTTLGLVAFLHVAVFYAFMTGLSGSLTKTNTAPLQNRILAETHPRELPPLPPPNLNPVKLEMPRLDADLTIAPDDAAQVVQSEVSTPPSSPPVEVTAVDPPPMKTLSQGGPGAGFPSPDDYYPLLSKHLEEQGAATVRVCVDPVGRLTDDPTVVTTSGSIRLDEAALKLARAGSGHYRATTQNGRGINACYPFRIRFQIKN